MIGAVIAAAATRSSRRTPSRIRLNAAGAVETSTCCQNVATEHQMAEKLMVDSVVLWARDYKVDGFRFDLMGHHSTDTMLAVRSALDALTVRRDGVDGKAVYLYGEGWNFGEVAGNALFEQATQGQLGGTGIGTFSDRARDRLPAWAAQLNCCAPRTWSAWAWPARCATTR